MTYYIIIKFNYKICYYLYENKIKLLYENYIPKIIVKLI